MRSICLDHLSLSDLTALELVDIASKLGCSAVSLFVNPLPLGPYSDLVTDISARREVKAALRSTGLSVGIIEPFMLDDNVNWDMMRRRVALASELGAIVNTLCFQQDWRQLEESIFTLAEIGVTEGAKIAIESFTLSTARTVADALLLADCAGPDVGLTIDTLHVMRTEGHWETVLSIPPSRICHLQINDSTVSPPEDLYLEATLERLPVGHGEFDLSDLLTALPELQLIGVESPFRARDGQTPLERATVLVSAAKKLFADLQN